MSKNDFDQIIRSKYEELEVPYHEGVWNRLRPELNSSLTVPRKTFNKRWAAIVAAVAIFGLVWAGAMYQFMNKQTEAVVKSSPVLVAPADSKAQPALPSVPVNQPISALKNNFPVANAYSRYLNKPFLAPGKRALVTIVQDNQSNSASSSTINTNTPSTILPEPTARQSLKNEVAQKNVLPNNLMLPGNENAYDGTPKAAQQRVQVGIVGALGYGGVSTNGYSIGVNTIAKLSNKVYVDNVIAFGSTQELYNVKPFQTPAGAAIVASRSASSAQNNINLRGNLFFVTVAPSLGVKLSKNLSIGAGGDVQRIVKNNVATPDDFYNEYVSDNSGSSVVLANPVRWKNWDAGISAKASIKLSKRIDVGLQYRQGMVNLLSEQAGMDLRRSYGTISLQYRILGTDDTAQ